MPAFLLLLALLPIMTVATGSFAFGVYGGSTASGNLQSGASDVLVFPYLEFNLNFAPTNGSTDFVTIPTRGLYDVQASLLFAPPSYLNSLIADQRSLSIIVDGDVRASVKQAAVRGSDTQIQVSKNLYLYENQLLSVNGSQLSGETLPVNSGALSLTLVAWGDY